ncbi:MAG: DPP IV N-terminal domain-containing protein [Bacteroidetes bacterium]|nr:DPP IV N-terminal domain-containing protein [Bacteroidota bacterium]
MRKVLLFTAWILCQISVLAQPWAAGTESITTENDAPEGEININRLRWLPGSHDFWVFEKQGIYVYNASNLTEKNLVLTAEQVKAAGLTTRIENIVWNNDRSKILIYTNSSRVWRVNSKGDYWYFEMKTGKGRQIGKGLKSSSLQFAKFSSDNKNVAYLSLHNLYVEDLNTWKITQLTKDGSDKIINGTFDWVYEEELSIRDGFSWSPTGKSIAFYRVDANTIPRHLMINNTDSLYPFVIPVEYPKAGVKPSSVKIGTINITTKKLTWMQIPGDPANNYLPRMNWAGNDELMAVQLNRLQNEATFYLCNAGTGKATNIYIEKQETGWIEQFNLLEWDANWWTWIDNYKYFLRTKEKDGWLHIYKISHDGKQEELLTKGNYDASLLKVDQTTGDIFFEATPYDGTQRYLYKVNINQPDTVRVTPAVFNGTNTYRFSPDAKFALHTNANISRNYNFRLVQLPDHKKVYPATEDKFTTPDLGFNLEKIKVKTVDGIDMDGIMAKPKDFDASKKYPVFFYVYGEPAAAVANDLPDFNNYIAELIPRGYIGIAMDNRGTPVMKGTAWRMAVYKKLGVVNSRDQAMAAKEILKWNFIDTSRVAVHGWSGGGAMTLNLLFRYPDIYKAGVAVSAVTDEHFYDNIYTERYMGLPTEDADAYRESSPITHAKNLKGHLLYMHGTGDDNVHYKNAENLINELVKQGKTFNMMIYPNRTHGIFEGPGTVQHVAKTFIQFIETYCPPGAR